MSENLRPKYRADIDGLRAIAVLSVVVYHAFPNVLPGGYVGVDIFFVISGYLISSIIFKGVLSNNFSFYEFYAHRVKRIFPSLIVVMCSVYVFAYYALFDDEFMRLSKHIAFSSIFVQNFILWTESGYFDIASELKPLMHLWSLGIEEQFYLLYPLLILLIWRQGFNILNAILILTLISLTLNILWVHDNPVLTFFSPMTRFWELFMGGILAWRQVSVGQEVAVKFTRFSIPLKIVNRFHVVFQSNSFSIVALLCVFVPLFLLDKTSSFPGWWAILPVTAAYLFISGGHQVWFNRVVLSNPLLVSIGLISYPLYLWHWPIISFFHIIHPEAFTVGAGISAIILAIVLAWLTYWFVERPIRFGKNSVNKTIVLCVLLGGLGGVGYGTYMLDGLNYRHKDFLHIHKQFAWNDYFKRDDDCLKRFGASSGYYCVVGSQKKVDVILIGDSHANHLFPGLNAALKKKNKNLLQIGQFGCLPFYGINRNNKNTCSDVAAKNLSFAISDNEADTIILTARGVLHFTGYGYGDSLSELKIKVQLSHSLIPTLQGNSGVFEYSMRDTLSKLVKTNKRIIFVLDVPEIGFDPKSCVSDRPWSLYESELRVPCAITYSEFFKRNHEYRSIINNVLHDFPSVSLFDPSNYLCDKEFCWAKKAGLMLYRDSHHLSIDGSMIVGEKLLQEINRN